jgi:sugar-specific transcriptional regulator TrmB
MATETTKAKAAPRRNHLERVRAGRHEPDLGSLPVTLLRDFEELGLNGSEARVLLALLRLGSGSSTQVARLSQMPRTAVYPVLEELSIQGLVVRVAGETPAVWATPGRDKVLDRLREVHEENFRVLQDKVEQARLALAQVLPETPSVALPFVHVIHGASEARRVHERLLAEAESEVLVCSRRPYPWSSRELRQIVASVTDRRLSVRLLYEAATMESPGALAFRLASEACGELAVQARVVDDLPIRLAIVDRAKVLLGMSGPDDPGGGSPTTLFVEHPGFAHLQAAGFESLWAGARPCPGSAGQ